MLSLLITTILVFSPSLISMVIIGMYEEEEVKFKEIVDFIVCIVIFFCLGLAFLMVATA